MRAGVVLVVWLAALPITGCESKLDRMQPPSTDMELYDARLADLDRGWQIVDQGTTACLVRHAQRPCLALLFQTSNIDLAIDHLAKQTRTSRDDIENTAGTCFGALGKFLTSLQIFQRQVDRLIIRDAATESAMSVQTDLVRAEKAWSETFPPNATVQRACPRL